MEGGVETTERVGKIPSADMLVQERDQQFYRK